MRCARRTCGERHRRKHAQPRRRISATRAPHTSATCERHMRAPRACLEGGSRTQRVDTASGARVEHAAETASPSQLAATRPACAAARDHRCHHAHVSRNRSFALHKRGLAWLLRSRCSPSATALLPAAARMRAAERLRFSDTADLKRCRSTRSSRSMSGSGIAASAAARRVGLACAGMSPPVPRRWLCPSLRESGGRQLRAVVPPTRPGDPRDVGWRKSDEARPARAGAHRLRATRPALSAFRKWPPPSRSRP